MNVLILGSNGFLGPEIAVQLEAAGHRTVGFGRSRHALANRGSDYVCGDRGNPANVLDAVVDRRIDIVIDVIAMQLVDTAPLLEALEGRIGQYVMLGSCDVYANYELLHRKREGIPAPGPVAEDATLRISRYPYRGPTARSPDAPDRHLDEYDKIPIEGRVADMQSPWTILRLPMVYGPGDRQRRFRWAIEPMLEGRDRLEIPRAWAHWQTTYGYVDNVAAAIARVVGSPHASRRVFNVAEPGSVSQIEWARRFAAALAWSGRIEPTNDSTHPFARRLADLDLSVPLLVSDARLRATFGSFEVIDEATALARTIERERSHLQDRRKLH